VQVFMRPSGGLPAQGEISSFRAAVQELPPVTAGNTRLESAPPLLRRDRKLILLLLAMGKAGVLLRLHRSGATVGLTQISQKGRKNLIFRNFQCNPLYSTFKLESAF
jgi:hypothetical protein